jgi:uncharacterized protein (DUF1919 family)
MEKWNRQKDRINWDNLVVRFNLDKDYATEDHPKDFGRLPYFRKVCLSKIDLQYIIYHKRENDLT